MSENPSHGNSGAAPINTIDCVSLLSSVEIDYEKVLVRSLFHFIRYPKDRSGIGQHTFCEICEDNRYSVLACRPSFA